MSNPTGTVFKSQTLAVAGLLILIFGGAISAAGQEIKMLNMADTYRPKNPISRRSVPVNDKKDSNKASEPALDKKQQEIDDAIEEGNSARDKSDYETALRSYRKITNELNPKEGRAHYGLGNIYAALYCSESAIEAYQAALKINPKYSEAQIGLSYVYLNDERYEDALQGFQRAVDLAPQRVEAMMGLGIALSKRGRSQEAVAQLSRILNSQSMTVQDQGNVHLALGNIYQNEQKWKEAAAEAEDAIRLLISERTASNQENRYLASAYVSLANCQISSAVEQFTSLGTRSIQDRATLAASAKRGGDNIQKAIELGYRYPQAHLLMSRAKAHQARYPEAVKEVDEYLKRISELESQLTSLQANLSRKCDYAFERLKAHGHWFLAHVLTIESNFETDPQGKATLLDKAIAEFTEGIKLKEDSLGRSGLGGAYFGRGKFEEAIKEYEKAIVLENDKASQTSYQMMIGLAFYRLERYEEAVAKFEETTRLDENNALLYDLLASAYEGLATKYLAKQDLEETFKLLTKAGAVRKSPSKNPLPYYALGTTYGVSFILKGDEVDFDKAVMWLGKAIAINPNSPLPYQGLGLLYFRRLKADEALTNLEKAIEYGPKDPSNYVTLGQVYLQLKGNSRAAAGQCKKAIEVKPDYADAYLQLGIVYHYDGDFAEAGKQVLEAIKHDPRYVAAYLELAAIFRDSKNYAEASKHLNKALELAPVDFSVYKELAKLYEAQSKNDDAIRYYEQAIENLKGASPFAKDLYLCRIERLKGQYQQTISCFQKIKVPISQSSDTTFHDIGLTHIANKNKKAALAQYEQLKQMKSTLAVDLLRQINDMK